MTPTMEEVAGWLRDRAAELYNKAKRLDNEFGQRGAMLNRAGCWLDRAAQVEAMGWRPISEAPKNERVLLWAEGWYAPNTGEWAKTGFSPDGYCEWAHQPTHFRPNVEPPVTP